MPKIIDIDVNDSAGNHRGGFSRIFLLSSRYLLVTLLALLYQALIALAASHNNEARM